MKQQRKQPKSWPKPADFELDDDVGVLIGSRIHRLVAGQVIGKQVIRGDSHTTFASPVEAGTQPAAKARPRKATPARAKAGKPAGKTRAGGRNG